MQSLLFLLFNNIIADLITTCNNDKIKIIDINNCNILFEISYHSYNYNIDGSNYDVLTDTTYTTENITIKNNYKLQYFEINRKNETNITYIFEFPEYSKYTNSIYNYSIFKKMIIYKNDLLVAYSNVNNNISIMSLCNINFFIIDVMTSTNCSILNESIYVIKVVNNTIIPEDILVSVISIFAHQFCNKKNNNSALIIVIIALIIIMVLCLMCTVHNILINYVKKNQKIKTIELYKTKSIIKPLLDDD